LVVSIRTSKDILSSLVYCMDDRIGSIAFSQFPCPRLHLLKVSLSLLDVLFELLDFGVKSSALGIVSRVVWSSHGIRCRCRGLVGTCCITASRILYYGLFPSFFLLSAVRSRASLLPTKELLQAYLQRHLEHSQHQPPAQARLYLFHWYQPRVCAPLCSL